MSSTKSIKAALGECHYCGLAIPAVAVNGVTAEADFDYKETLGGNVKWHHLDPRYPNCYDKERRDPSSVWYDHPRRYIEHEDGDGISILADFEDEE